MFVWIYYLPNCCVPHWRAQIKLAGQQHPHAQAIVLIGLIQANDFKERAIFLLRYKHSSSGARMRKQ
jgi:hypothetical protein